MSVQWNEDDLFYVCTMIEYTARKTHNRSRDIVKYLSDKNLTHQLKAACVNHCLSFEQVCDEWIEEYGITEGTYDNFAVYKKNSTDRNGNWADLSKNDIRCYAVTGEGGGSN